MNPEKAFIDTSGFYALMDRSDAHHNEAARIWPSLLAENVHLYTSNYIAIETVALAQNRLGFEAAYILYRDLLPVVEMLWIAEAIHRTALELWLTLGRSKLSLVDCSSFVLMRQREIDRAFAFDRHFADQGFVVLPYTST